MYLTRVDESPRVVAACRTGIRSRRARPVGSEGFDVRDPVDGCRRHTAWSCSPPLSRMLACSERGADGSQVDGCRPLTPGRGNPMSALHGGWPALGWTAA